MCGILGLSGFQISKEEFVFELNRIIHRGPDGFGVFEDTDAQVILGHRRLAIIDTDDRSNQPMSVGERYTFIYNGEIYNYREIREYLVSKGCTFITESDTEVLLQLLIIDGPDALNKCNGMWAFVLYDSHDRSLLFGRDRLGKKPLYYHRADNKIAFCSEMKGLYSFLPSIEYSKDYINQAMFDPMSVEQRPDCLICGIEKFPAGCYGVFKDSKFTISRYYNPDRLIGSPTKRKTFNEATEELGALLVDSCNLRMRSDVPVGTALSGGVDSSLITSIIAQLGYSQSDFYTALIASFPNSMLDETDDAIMVAENARVNYQTVDIIPKVTEDSILWSIFQFEEIVATAPIPFNTTYQAFRRNGVVVTLDGHGADELFGGYTMDLYSKLDDDYPNVLSMRKTLQLLSDMYGGTKLIPFSEVNPHFKARLLADFSSRDFGKLLSSDSYRTKLHNSTFYGILPTLLRNFDRFSMQAGVEVRMPFLDYRIVEFAFDLKTKYIIKDGFSKAIVREVGKNIVPKQILNNKRKTGWNSPMGEWLKSSLKEWYLDEIHSLGFQKCDLIDVDSYKKRALNYLNSQTINQNEAQSLWLNLQPYLIEKSNSRYASTGLEK
jgi:asparagine synthase (glutamine-hydrolysing)